MRRELVQTIRVLGVPRSTVAKIAGLYLCDVTGYLNGRLDLNEKKVGRIAQVVADVVRVVEALPMKVDLRDPENVKRLICAVNDAVAQIGLFDAADAEVAARDLPALLIRALNESPA